MSKNDVVENFIISPGKDNRIISVNRRNFMYILASVLCFCLALFYLLSNKTYHYINSIILFGGFIINLYGYISLLKKGYIKIYKNRLSINPASLVSKTKMIYFENISEVIEKPNSYIIVSKNNTKIKISNFSIKDVDFKSFLNEMNKIKELVVSIK
jgi:hypothetical protein